MTRAFRSLESTICAADAAIARGELDTALNVITRQFEAWLAAPELTRNALWGSRELDARAARIGALVPELAPVKTDLPLPALDRTRPLDVYLFTRTELGGHVRVGGDFVRAAPDRSSVIVLANQGPVPVSPEDAERLATPLERIISLPPSSLLGRTRALISLLAQLRPDRVFVFNHHDDVCVVAAAAANAARTQTYYVHHGDFLPALGVYLDGVKHLDVTPRAHTFCSSVLGLQSAYTPLVADDRGRRPTKRLGSPPVIATCGTPAKYDLTYRLPYHDVVASLLAETGARLYHIGPVLDDQRDTIRETLRSRGVDETRWRQIDNVPSVWDAMQDLGVDLYLNSFPQRGARVAVEVMGSGTPAVWHLGGPRYRSVDLHLAYPQAAAWSDAAELIAIVRGLDDAWIAAQGDAARAHYERVHHPSILAALARDGFRSGAPFIPGGERTFSFEFEHLERSWHRLTSLIAPAEAGEPSGPQ